MKVGILGAGQLSWMMVQYGQEAGMALTPVGKKTCAHLETCCEPVYVDRFDVDALDALCGRMDVVTFESENIPYNIVSQLEQKKKITPSIEALKIFQNRFYEKNYLVSQGLHTARYLNLEEEADFDKVGEYVGFPAIVKTNLNGYDGRGQALVNNKQELAEAWRTLGRHCIVEEFLDFHEEISLIGVRDWHQNIVYYPVSRNYHRNGQLRLSLVEGDHPLQAQAEQAMRTLMTGLNYIGCMTLEFFVKEGRLIVNEVAPRVHNSGHWTINGASDSQFRLHLQAITGKTVSRPTIECPVAMINCIGISPSQLALPEADCVTVYDYQKEIRPERKQGHINVSGSNLAGHEFYSMVATMLEYAGEHSLAGIVVERIKQVA